MMTSLPIGELLAALAALFTLILAIVGLIREVRVRVKRRRNYKSHPHPHSSVRMRSLRKTPVRARVATDKRHRSPVGRKNRRRRRGPHVSSRHRRLALK
jgi:hypothetical protein